MHMVLRETYVIGLLITGGKKSNAPPIFVLFIRSLGRLSDLI